MTGRYYRVAGLTIRVLCPRERMYHADGVLAPYAAEAAPWDYQLLITPVEQLSEPVGSCVFRDWEKWVYEHGAGEIRYIGAVENSLQGAYMRVFRQGNQSVAEVTSLTPSGTVSPRQVLTAMAAEHLLAEYGGFVLHASFVRVGDRAILFTAPSGTGKSTQAQLWQQHRGAKLINGDRAAVMCDDRGVWACGIPFPGSSGVCENEKLPLAAIVYLSQGKENTVTRLTGLRAFRRVWEGCCVNTWNREDVRNCTQSVIRSVTAVPVWHLSCRADVSAVQALEEAMKQEA